jgi:four helix bundle protein
MVPNFRANTLEERLVQFAVNIVTLVGQSPQNPQAEHIGNQILRSGTAAAPNYGEARAAESRADFVHKLKICLKELNETKTRNSARFLLHRFRRLAAMIWQRQWAQRRRR